MAARPQEARHPERAHLSQLGHDAMQRILLPLLVTICTVLPAAECTRVCVFGKAVKTEFAKYGVIADVFSREELTSPGERTLPQVCESLDNSLLVVFAEQTPTEVHDALFSNAAVCRSMQSLLTRGGTFLVGPVSWRIVAHWPKSMRGFWRENGLALIGPEHYKGETPDKTYTAVPATKSRSRLLTEPNRLAEIWRTGRACRYMPQLPEGLKPLLMAKGHGFPLAAVQERVCGAGRLVYSYVFSSFRTTDDALMENLVVSLYGRRQRISNRARARAKLGTAPRAGTAQTLPKRFVVVPKTSIAPVVDHRRESMYDQATKLELRQYMTGEAPQKTTQVEMLRDDQALYIFFTCFDSRPDTLRTKVTIRDGRVWEDDCVEVLLTDSLRRGPVVHMIVSASGVCFDEKDQNANWDGTWRSSAGRSATGWTAELAIPFTDLGMDPAVTVLKGNLCREEKELGELTTWSPAPAGFADRSGFAYFALCSRAEFAQQVAGPRSVKPLYDKGYLVWAGEPYAKCYADSLPEELLPTREVQVTIARAEKEAAALLLSNLSDQTVTLRVEPEFFLNDSTIRWQSLAKLKEAVPRLNPFKERQMDPLVCLNEANLITLPPYETRKLWLEFRTELPAGTYNWQLTFVPVDSLWPKHRVQIQIEVLALEFPTRMPFMVYNFGPYGFSWARGKELRRTYLETCRDYHFSHVITSFPFKTTLRARADGGIAIAPRGVDYLGEEKLIADLGLKWVYSYGVQTEFSRHIRSRGFKGKIHDVEWTGLFRTWAENWLGTLSDNNFTPDQYLVPIIDEVKDEIAADVLRTAQLLKAIAPTVRTYQDPATWTSFETVKMLAPVTDLWIPWEPRLKGRESSAAELAFYQQSPQPFCPYLCGVNTQILPVLSYYRLRGLRSWSFGADGFCLWSFNSWRGNDWAEFDQRDKSGDNCLFHHGDTGPMPTIRAEAFHEAIEDFYLLRLAAKHLGAPAVAELVHPTSTEKLLRDASPAALGRWRTQLMRALDARVRLSSTSLPARKGSREPE